MIAVLCGGFGAARFLDGLRGCAGEVCCIVNTGDDFDYVGLRVCPDLDSVLYALAGCFDELRGWGPVDDSFAANRALARYGQDWFRLGDRDLALSLVRTSRLAAGRPLSDVTTELCSTWGVLARILPATDDAVRTRVRTAAGWLGFQDFIVREQTAPPILEVAYDGAADATPAPGVLPALAEADLVVIAPSNPITSVGPILAVPGVREAIAGRRAPTVAVSPIVVNAEPAADAERWRGRLRAIFMDAVGLAHRPSAVASAYRDVIDGFVLDERDLDEEDKVLAELGLPVLAADTLAGPGRRTALAEAVIGFGLALTVSQGR
jgi:LPPG:FO 2-phospho-L-lactate transferase